MTMPTEDPLLDLDVPQPALLFDLDGTLVDSVYRPHVKQIARTVAALAG